MWRKQSTISHIIVKTHHIDSRAIICLGGRFPPLKQREEIGMMYLTLDDVVQLGLLIVAIIAVVRHIDR